MSACRPDCARTRSGSRRRPVVRRSQTRRRSRGCRRSCSELLFHLEGGEHGPNSVVDVVGLPRTVDAAKDPALLVVGDHGLGLLMVGGKPLANDLGLVIVSNLQPSAADVADVVVLRGIELD